MEKEQRKNLDSKCKEILRFYVTTYFDPHREEIKSELRKHNYFIDPDMFDNQVDDYLASIVEEAVNKFHQTFMLIIDSFIAGRESKVREFELLFVDLMKRTLVKDMKEEKEKPTPIIIIADPNVKSELN